jgi:hypothetical protein
MSDIDAAPAPEPVVATARDVRRAEPRAGVAITGAGCAVAVLGVIVIGGDQLGGDGSGGTQLPGIVLCLMVVIAGFVMIAAADRGPLVTAGVVASAAGIPPLLFFLSYDDGSFPPFSTEGILGGAAAGWIAAYYLSPGRGHPTYLGAGLLASWLLVLEVIESPLSFPFLFLGSSFASVDASGTVVDGPASGSLTSAPDFTTIGMISLLFGAGYALASRRLDRAGRHGIATPFAFAALPVLAVAVVGLADELQEIGTGILLVLIGTALAAHGATIARRATTWIGGIAVALGVVIILSEVAPEDDVTVTGVLLLLGGAAIVIAAHLAAARLGEPDEMEVGPTVLVRPVRPTAAPPVDPGL